MIINRNSWHYKVAMLGDNEFALPKTLCPYFWYVVFKLFMVSTVTVAVSVGSWLIGLPVIGKILSLMGITLSKAGLTIPAVLTGILIIALVVGTGFLCVMGVSWLKDGFKEKMRERRWAKAQAAEEAGVALEPNVLVEYIKTRKSKMCPIIEYETIDKAKK